MIGTGDAAANGGAGANVCYDGFGRDLYWWTFRFGWKNRASRQGWMPKNREIDRYANFLTAPLARPVEWPVPIIPKMIIGESFI
jgi:hypothetical protein